MIQSIILWNEKLKKYCKLNRWIELKVYCLCSSSPSSLHSQFIVLFTSSLYSLPVFILWNRLLYFPPVYCTLHQFIVLSANLFYSSPVYCTLRQFIVLFTSLLYFLPVYCTLHQCIVLFLQFIVLFTSLLNISPVCCTI